MRPRTPWRFALLVLFLAQTESRAQVPAPPRPILPPQVVRDGPPAHRPADDPGAAPGPGLFFVPGEYIPDTNGVNWRPGFWTEAQPGWTWIPARWLRLSTGWTFQEGRWIRDPESVVNTLPEQARSVEPTSSIAPARTIVTTVYANSLVNPGLTWWPVSPYGYGLGAYSRFTTPWSFPPVGGYAMYPYGAWAYPGFGFGLGWGFGYRPWLWW